MWAELRGYVSEFKNEDLKRLVFSFLDDESIAAAYRHLEQRYVPWPLLLIIALTIAAVLFGLLG